MQIQRDQRQAALARAGSEALQLTAMHQEPLYQDVLKSPEVFLEQCGEEVNRALRNLSTAQRSCILLRGVEKFSYKEIAEILDIPVGTVMTHLSRGRAKLRKELTAYAEEQGVIRKRPKLVPLDNADDTGHETESAGGI